MQSSPEYESSVLDHRFGGGDPYTMGVEEEYMLLDSETLDLRAAHRHGAGRRRGLRAGARAAPELMQSVLEIATPVCRDIGGVTTELHRLRAAVTDVARQNGSARRLGRHAPLQPVRAAAHHNSRPLPRARRPAPVRGAA